MSLLPLDVMQSPQSSVGGALHSSRLRIPRHATLNSFSFQITTALSHKLLCEWREKSESHCFTCFAIWAVIFGDIQHMSPAEVTGKSKAGFPAASQTSCKSAVWHKPAFSQTGTCPLSFCRAHWHLSLSHQVPHLRTCVHAHAHRHVKCQFHYAAFLKHC